MLSVYAVKKPLWSPRGTLIYKSWVFFTPFRVKIRGLLLLRVLKWKITTARIILVPFRIEAEEKNELEAQA